MPDKVSDWTVHEKGAIRDQLRKILDSALFARAERLGRFLEFVVHETLSGRADRLNQFAIAMDAFDRDASFDPSSDAIVRVEAGRLRSKLLEYYDELGRNDPIRVELPKRSYASTFQFRAVGNSSEALMAETEANRDVFSRDDFGRIATLVEPTVAVLPFINMRPDSEQEYFADGVTEDLITDLSMVPGISVISRQSTFVYKGAAVTVQQVCEELGANLVLEGSVRKVGGKVRITAQLIEGSNGRHLWAQRFDRDFESIFDIQDEVNRNIVNACSLEISESGRRKQKRRGTDVIDAYDYVLRGMREAETNTMEGSARARYCFDSALELDDRYSVAYVRLAINYIFRWIQGWSNSAKESTDKGLELALKAVAVDDELALAHAALCWAFLWQGEHDKAIAEGRMAIGLDPDDVVALERLALCLSLAGEAECSLPLIDRARRLNPNNPYEFARGAAMFMMSNYAQAVTVLQGSFERNPNFLPSGLYLAASHALAGNQAEAEAIAASIREASPNYRLAKDFRAPFENSQDHERFLGGLRQAGFSC